MTKRESMKDSSEMKLASVERKALRSPSVIFFNSATCLDVLTVLTSVGKDIAGNKSDKVRALDRAATECIRMWQREIKLHAYAVVRSWIFSPPKSEYSPQVIYELLSHAIPAFIRRNQLLTGLMSNFHSKFGQWLQRTLHKDTHTSAKPLNDLTATQVVKLLHELRWKNMPPKERPGNVFDSSSRCWLNPPSVFKWSVPVEEVLYALESNGVSVTSPEFAAGGLKWFLQFQRTGQCLRAYLHRANAQIPALWLAPVECTVELLDCQNKGIGGQPASRSGWSVLDGNFGYGVPPFKHVTSKSLRQGKASRHIDSDKNLKLKVYLSVDPGLAFILNHVVANFGDFSAENESWVARGKTGDVPLLAELPLVPIVRIFRSDALNVPSEKVVLEAMLTWTRTALCFGDGPKSAAERQAAAERLSSYIRFRHLDFPTLYKAARDPLLAKLKLLECNMDSSLQRDIQGGGASKGMPKRDGYIGVPVETGLATVDVFKCLVQNIERLKQEKAEMAGEVKRLAAVVQSLVKKERKFESMTAKSKEDEKHDPPVCTREEGGEKRGC
uniref:MATH domain-containing protein n=1 Tax=Amorphochlora amoebiformis TaxID=1561963 RepID=A0A6T6VUD8_9EUKA|mmetsp:Transcript_26980/g.42822  ORF Transcript_26980/g.42822 Transcript_26980/m.42822 type:complete len:556 (+) Transcript_26980:518-2185(+)